MIARRTFLLGTAAGALGICFVAPKFVPEDQVPSMGSGSHVDLALDALDPGVGTPFERAVAMFNEIPRSSLVPSVGEHAHNPILAANQFGLGICDDYSRVFSNVLRRAGVRVWIRAMDGHVGVDALLDGRLIYIDPTQGYWIEKGGEVLSAEQISKLHPERQIQFRSFRDRSVKTAALSTEPLMALVNEDNWLGEEFGVVRASNTLVIPDYVSHELEPLLGHMAQPYFVGIDENQQVEDASSFSYLKRSVDIRQALSTETPSRAHAHNRIAPSSDDPKGIEFRGRNSQFSFELDRSLLVNLVSVRFDASHSDPANKIIIRLCDRYNDVAEEVGPFAGASEHSYDFNIKSLSETNPRLLDGCVVWFIVLHDEPDQASTIRHLNVTYYSQVTTFFKDRYDAWALDNQRG